MFQAKLSGQDLQPEPAKPFSLNGQTVPPLGFGTGCPAVSEGRVDDAQDERWRANKESTINFADNQKDMVDEKIIRIFENAIRSGYRMFGRSFDILCGSFNFNPFACYLTPFVCSLGGCRSG